MRSAFLLSLFVLFFSVGSSSQGVFAQFIVHDLDNDEQCRWIEDHLQSKEQVISARAEHFSDNVLLFVADGQVLEESQIVQWCAEYGYTISCYRSGHVGSDKILRLHSSECDVPLQQLKD